MKQFDYSTREMEILSLRFELHQLRLIDEKKPEKIKFHLRQMELLGYAYSLLKGIKGTLHKTLY